MPKNNRYKNNFKLNMPKYNNKYKSNFKLRNLINSKNV